MKKIDGILSEIRNMDHEDLNRVIEAVKFARAQNHREATRRISVGDTVEFDGRGGKRLTGVVKKVAIKYATVDCGFDGRWRVPAGNLRVRSAA